MMPGPRHGRDARPVSVTAARVQTFVAVLVEKRLRRTCRGLTLRDG
jgi:hypothetical protein